MSTRFVAVLLLALAAPVVPVAAGELTAEETRRVQDGEILIRAALDEGQRRGTVHAALMVDAPPEVVYEAMTHCADALEFVPHLKACRQRSATGEGDVTFVEHEVDFGWYAPRLRYEFRADLVAGRSIEFRQVRGDFQVNEGRWDLEPAANGQRTLLRYRVHIDPPRYVPNWLARATFRKELPRMLENLKRHCEADTAPRAQANLPR